MKVRRIIAELIKSMRWVAFSLSNPIDWFTILISDEPGIVITKSGVQVSVDGRDSLSFMRLIFHKKIYGNFTGKERTVLDIGANMGTYSIYAAANSHAECMIYTFEPNPSSFELVQKNIAANQFGQKIKAVNVAVVGDATDRELFFTEASLCSNLYDFRNEIEGAKVLVWKLSDIFDHFGLVKMDLIKMNCEGAEYEIIMSAPPSLLKKIGEIRMEYHQFTTASKKFELPELMAYLAAHGFARTVHWPFHQKHGIAWFVNKNYEK